MTIRYTVIDNPLVPNNYYVRIQQGNKISLDELTERIAKNAPYSSSTAQSVISDLKQAIIDTLLEGDVPSIDDLVFFTVSYTGSYDSPDYVIKADNNQLKVNAHSSRSLQKAILNQAQYVKELATVKAPMINSVFDYASGYYDVISLGGILHLEGDDLKFNPNQADEGVFLIGNMGRIRLDVYSKNSQKNIDALVPSTLSLVGEEIQVLVYTRYTSEGELRQGRYSRQVMLLQVLSSTPYLLFDNTVSINAITGYATGSYFRLDLTLVNKNYVQVVVHNAQGQSEPARMVLNTPKVIPLKGSSIELQINSFSAFTQNHLHTVVKVI